MRRAAIIAGVSAVVLLSGGIAALMLWPEHVPEPTPTPPAPVRETGDLVRESREEVLRVRFQPSDGQEYILNYNHDEQEITLETADAVFEGEQATMHSLFSRAVLLSGLVQVTNNADDSQLAMFGLNDPVMTVSIERVDGTSLDFQIGDIQAAGQGRYARLPDSREVFLLTSVQSSLLTLDVEDIYDISFIPYEELHDPEMLMYYFDYIILELENDTVELHRRTEDDWNDVPIGASSVRILQPFVAESNDSMLARSAMAIAGETSRRKSET